MYPIGKLNRDQVALLLINNRCMLDGGMAFVKEEPINFG
jgi:hypothetical protein